MMRAPTRDDGGPARPLAGRALAGLMVPWMLACLALAGATPPAEAARIRKPKQRGNWIVGQVVNVTSSTVYLNIGARHGLKKGDRVQIRVSRKEALSLRLDDVGPSFSRASLPSGERVPVRSSRARARWRGGTKGLAKTKGKVLPAPLSTTEMSRLWQGVDLQRPLLVGYRATTKAGHRRQRKARGKSRVHGAFALAYGGIFDLGDSTPQSHYHQLALLSALDVRGLFFRWLSYSHRLEGRLQLARDLDSRPHRNSRPKLLVRRLALGFNLSRARLALGRLQGGPHPDAGMVDGAAARIRLTRGLYLGAFGGLAPDLADLSPQTTATRFGVYSALRLAARGQRRWSLAADLGVVGTTFAEELDRKVLSGQLIFERRRFSAEARFVLDLYGDDHPSGLSGLDASQINARVAAQPSSWLLFSLDYQRYRLVPSRELLALGLSREDPVDSGRLSLDVRLGPGTTLAFDSGVSHQSEASWIAWGQLGGRISQLLGDSDALRMHAQASRGNIFDAIGGRLSYGLMFGDGLDCALAYGLYYDNYRQQGESHIRHSASLTIDLLLGRGWSVTLDSDLQLSEEERVLSLIATSALSF